MIKSRRITLQTVWLSIVFLFGTAVRLFRLGYQSQWNDEALSVAVAKGTIGQILTNQFYSRHPPGYYLLLHYWLNWFGDSDFVLRLFSAMAGIASLFIMYALGKSLLNESVGLWAAAVTTIMPFHLFYSQEIRAYSWLFFLSALLLLCQAKIWRGGGGYWWLAYGVTAVTGLYMHYLFTLIVGVSGFYFIAYSWISKTKADWRAFIITHVIIGFSYIPLFPWIFGEVDRGNYFSKEISFASYVSLPLNYTVGQFLPSPLIMMGFGLIVAIVLITLLQAGRAIVRRSASLYALFFILLAYWLPVTVTYLVSIFWIPLTTPRLMIVAVPGLYLMMAWGAVVPKEKNLNIALIIGLVLVGFIADYNWLFNPAYQRLPVQDAVALLEERIAPDEMVIYANDSGFRLFHLYAPNLRHYLYYDQDNKFANLRVRPSVIELTGGGILTPEDKLTGTFWLVLHQDFDVALQEDIFQQLEARYTRLDAFNIEGVRLYHYQVEGNW